MHIFCTFAHNETCVKSVLYKNVFVDDQHIVRIDSHICYAHHLSRMQQAEVHAESEGDDDDAPESAGEEQRIRGCPKSGRKWKTIPLQK